MDKIPQSADMIDDFLRKRERLAYKTTTALTEGIVKALNMRRFSGFFTNRTMPVEGQDSGVGLPEIV